VVAAPATWSAGVRMTRTARDGSHSRAAARHASLSTSQRCVFGVCSCQNPGLSANRYDCSSPQLAASAASAHSSESRLEVFVIGLQLSETLCRHTRRVFRSLQCLSCHQSECWNPVRWFARRGAWARIHQSERVGLPRLVLTSTDGGPYIHMVQTALFEGPEHNRGSGRFGPGLHVGLGQEAGHSTGSCAPLQRIGAPAYSLLRPCSLMLQREAIGRCAMGTWFVCTPRSLSRRKEKRSKVWRISPATRAI